MCAFASTISFIIPDFSCLCRSIFDAARGVAVVYNRAFSGEGAVGEGDSGASASCKTSNGGEVEGRVAKLELMAVKAVPVIGVAFGTWCLEGGREERHLYRVGVGEMRGAADENGGSTSLPGTAVGFGMVGIELFFVIYDCGYSSEYSKLCLAIFHF